MIEVRIFLAFACSCLCVVCRGACDDYPKGACMFNKKMSVAVLALFCFVVVVSSTNAAVTEADQKRMDLIKSMHEREVAQAKLVYERAVERANAKARNVYEATIRGYEARKDQEGADQLKKQLVELVGEESVADTGSKNPPGHVKMINAIGPVVNAADGEKLDARKLSTSKYMLVYFSAQWCPPCRGFTPKLVEFVNTKRANDNFNLVFVSNDRTEQAMFKYMTEYKMPWVAVPFDRIKPSGLQSAYGGNGIPNLVLVGPDGQVISGSYRDGKYVGPQAVLNDLDALLNKQS